MVLAGDFCPGVAPGALHVLMDVETHMAPQMPRVSRWLSGGLRDRQGKPCGSWSCSAWLLLLPLLSSGATDCGPASLDVQPQDSWAPGKACENPEWHPEAREGASGMLSESCSFLEPVVRLDWILPSASFRSDYRALQGVNKFPSGENQRPNAPPDMEARVWWRSGPILMSDGADSRLFPKRLG